MNPKVFFKRLMLVWFIGIVTIQASNLRPKVEESEIQVENSSMPTPWPSLNCCFDPSKVNDNAICTMQFAPVCGCDGKTYSNICFAKSKGILEWTIGCCNPACN
eukprot:gene2206-4294_t